MSIIYVNTINQPVGTVFNLGATAGLKYVLLSSGFAGSSSPGSAAFDGSGASQGVTVFGTAVAENIAVIRLTGAGTAVNIATTGQIVALEPQTDPSGTYAIYLPGANDSVENAGTIIGQAGIELNGGLVHNSGTINCSTTGIFSDSNLTIDNSGNIQSAFGTAISVSGTMTLTNSGFISGKLTGLDGTIHNSGTINGAISIGGPATVWNTGTFGSDLNFTPSSAGVTTNSLFNDGIIEGNVSNGTIVGFPANLMAVDNSGTIDGTIFGATDADRVTNSGTVHDVLLGGGADRLVNTGLVLGVVDFGGGAAADVLRNSGTINDDVLGFGTDGSIIRNSGRIDGIVSGSSGIDNLTNSGSIAALNLGNGNDVVTFLAHGSCDTVVHGDLGNDNLQGARADDVLYGDGGADTLRGGAGDDTLVGGIGNDKMFGGTGEDVLTGSGGKDELNGGSGADVFVFTGVTSVSAPATFDTIQDFKSGEDHIDLSGNGFVFASYLGTGAFLNNAVAHVRYVTDATGGLNILIDIDGNTSTDAQIHLDGISALTRDDFLF